MSKFSRRAGLPAHSSIIFIVLLFGMALHGQSDDESIKPVPILTGSSAYFTQVNGGQAQNTPSISPLLLAPIGDKWLVEAKGYYSDTFGQGNAGTYGGTSDYGLLYAQVDYIASRYVTLSAGRFLRSEERRVG